MPSITTVHESLPYIDAEPTEAERLAADALIAAERSQVPDDPHHALLPAARAPGFTPLLAAELDRIAASPDPARPPPLRAVDTARYNSLPDPSSLPPGPAELRSALEQAYTSAAYLASRRQHLALLDSYGKNAWLVGNWRLDAELKAVERELAAARRDIDLVTIQRQRTQNEAGAEITGLEEAWKKGVGRVLETEIAAEGVRREVLEAQRARP